MKPYGIWKLLESYIERGGTMLQRSTPTKQLRRLVKLSSTISMKLHGVVVEGAPYKVLHQG
jgi:hypothetical protein